jgi:hypothetical protein
MRLAIHRVWDALEAGGYNPRGRPEKFSALCPAHDDRTPSLDVAQGEKGAVLTCRSHECPPERIVGAVGLEMRDLFDDDGARDLAPRPVQRRRSSPPPCPYTDEQVKASVKALQDSEPMLEWLWENRGWEREGLADLEVGWDPADKDLPIWFPIRGADRKLIDVIRYQPSPSKRINTHDGRELKIMATKDISREPFPSPATVPEGEPIVLVEGETDAPTGRSLGFYTVGLPGQKWDPKWTKQLAGRQLLVVVENDDAGRKFADRVEEKLGTVARLDLSGFAGDKSGYDLTDLVLEVGHEKAANVVRATLEEFSVMEKPTPAESVDGAKLLDEIAEFLRRFVVVTKEQAAVLAVYVLHTHAIEAAETTPYLAVTSAAMQSGKTRLGIEVLGPLVANPLPTLNASVSALFRSIDERLHTVLFDEVDAIFKGKNGEKEDLRGLINGGYRKGAKALRCIGEGTNQQVRPFSVFSPKVLIGIGGLPPTVADRSIHIRLKRRARNEALERARPSKIEREAKPFHDRAATWAEQNLDVLTRAEPLLPDELDDRAQDGAEPLLAIADVAGGEWPKRLRGALVTLFGDKPKADDTQGLRLLADVRRVMDTLGCEAIHTADLIDALAKDETAPWGDWHGPEHNIRAKEVSDLLHPFINERPTSIRIGESNKRGYRREWFTDAWERWLPPTPAEAQQAQHPQQQARNGDSGNGHHPQPQAQHDPQQQALPDAANPGSCRDVADVADVADVREREEAPHSNGAIRVTLEEFAVPGGPNTNSTRDRDPQDNGNMTAEQYALQWRETRGFKPLYRMGEET